MSRNIVFRIHDAFGVETSAKKSVCFLNDNELLYLVGLNIVKFDLKLAKKKITSIQVVGKIESINAHPDLTHLVLISIENKNTYVHLLDIKSDNYTIKRSIYN